MAYARINPLFNRPLLLSFNSEQNMKQFEKILLAIDVNTDNTEQIKSAIKIAHSYNSQIIILIVLPNEIISNELKKLLHDAIKESLIGTVESIRDKGVVVNKYSIEYGDPVDKILNIANLENVDLIVVGSGKEDKRVKCKLGNIAEKLIRFSEIPIWVVKLKQKQTLTNILCPVDFSIPSRYALINAIHLSKKFGAKLRILNVVEPLVDISPWISADLDRENAYRIEFYKKRMQDFIEEFKIPKADCEIEVLEGYIHEKIIETVEQCQHDLLIMGTTGRSGLKRLLLGSVAEKVARDVPCSFVTIKSKPNTQIGIKEEVEEIKYHFKTASSLSGKKQFEDAIKHYMKCIQINNLHIPSYYRLAQLHDKLGNNKEATYYFDLARSLHNDLWDKKTENELKKIL